MVLPQGLIERWSFAVVNLINYPCPHLLTHTSLFKGTQNVDVSSVLR